MIQGPSVFVPTPPEGDGITLPTLLSVLAHGLLIGFILYTHQAPTLEAPPGIEATMVSPEQLAQMQGQILANRAAMAEMGASSAGDSDYAPMESSASLGSASANATRNSGSRRVPVFVRSDSPSAAPVEDGIMVTREYQLQVQEANAEYERKMAELAAQIDQAWENDAKANEEQAREREKIRQARIDQLKHIQANPPKIERPTRPNVKTGKPAEDSAPISIDFGTDGQAKVSTQGDPSGRTDAGRAGGGGRSVDSYKNEIISKIQSNFQTPQGSQDNSVLVKLVVDDRGVVKGATAMTSNAAIKKAAEKAANDSSPLPIDFDNPESFRRMNVRINIE